jgi:DNA-3-methyladenine glycosylase
MFKPLRRDFFNPSAERVAPALLGKWLVRNTPAGPCGGPIVETEGYIQGDPACHAFCGPTARNRVMWGRPGVAYVYYIYGNHYCVNAVCCPEGTAEAVLIRAAEAALGVDWMLQNRPVTHPQALTSGPGKLCSALRITRELDGADLCDATSPLYIAENPEPRKFLRSAGPVVRTRRIGITKAADLPLRFYLRDSPYISRRVRGTAAAFNSSPKRSNH